MSTPLMPERHEDAPVIVIAHNPVPELESPRPRDPTESNFDRLWRSITGVSLGWFEHEDGGYFILWYELNEKFVEFHPAERQLLTIRIEGPDDRVALAADPGLTWADNRTLYVHADYSERAVDWLTTNREAVRVYLTRKTPAHTALGKRPRREIGFVPKRARHVARFC